MSKFQKISFLPRVVAILGPMHVGKTLQLMEHIDRFSRCEFKCLVMKHDTDNRYTETLQLIAHNSAQLLRSDFVEIIYFNYELAKNILDSKEQFNGYDVIAIDEAHFLTEESDSMHTILADLAAYIVGVLKKGFIFTAVDRWASGGIISVISMCLDRIKPDEIIYCKGICRVCKSPHGIFTKRIAAKETNTKSEADNIQVGGSEIYVTVCRECYNA